MNLEIKQWYACTGCEFKTELYPFEVKIKVIEEEVGKICPNCGSSLFYSVGINGK